jgi:hypothetical protein
VRTLLGVTLAARAYSIVTLAAGPLGAARVFLPMAGSLLTYAHVGRPTAPSGSCRSTTDSTPPPLLPGRGARRPEALPIPRARRRYRF